MADIVLTFAFLTTLLAGSIAFGVVYNSARITLAERAREEASDPLPVRLSVPVVTRDDEEERDADVNGGLARASRYLVSSSGWSAGGFWFMRATM